MSSCVMKMSKVALASTILFSVSSDKSGSQCEALLLSKKILLQQRQENTEADAMCVDVSGNLKNCDDFVSDKTLKGHIYRLKTDTKGRIAFDNSYCVKNKVPGFANGVKAALAELIESRFGTGKETNGINGRKMFIQVIRAVWQDKPDEDARRAWRDQDEGYSKLLRQDMQRHAYWTKMSEWEIIKPVFWKDLDRYRFDLNVKRGIAAAHDIRSIAREIRKDLNIISERSKIEAVNACISEATKYLTYYLDMSFWSNTHDEGPRWSGPFIFDNSYCVERGVPAFEEEMRLALGKLTSSTSEIEVRNIFNKVIKSVEDASSTTDQKTKNAIAAASDIYLIVGRIENDSIFNFQKLFFQNKLKVLGDFQWEAEEYLTRKVNSMTWTDITGNYGHHPDNYRSVDLREFYDDKSSTFYNDFVAKIVHRYYDQRVKDVVQPWQLWY